MAKQRNKNLTGWSRFRLWVENNQKVVWVLLLLIISPMFAFPVTSFMNPRSESRIIVDRVYGEKISQADYKRTSDALGLASVLTVGTERTLGIDRIAEFAGSSPPGPFARIHVLLGAEAPLAYYIFKKKALDMGLRVPDEELAEHVREIWQWTEAQSLASAEVLSRSSKDDSKDQSANLRRQIEMLDLTKKKKAELEAGRVFDGALWSQMVMNLGRRVTGGMRVNDFEGFLRDLYLIAKLEDSVRSSVEVTPGEAYEKYRRDSQTRKLSWAEFQANDALKEAASKAITAADVKAYYDLHASDFEKPTALRSKWLLVPLDHFKEKAAAAITEEDIESYYEEYRNDYRKPTILSGEGSFAVRSQEESAKLREAAFKRLEEVKDKVREDAIAKRADRDMTTFATQLRPRLRPDKGMTEAERKAPAATFESLAKEFPFLKTGVPAFVSRDEAKDAFGDAYTAQVGSWFARADSARRSGPAPTIEAPEFALQGEKGMVYYQKPEIRENFRPSLQDTESKVREALVKAKATAWIVDALVPVKEGKKTLEEAVAAGIDVQLPVVTAALPAGAASAAATTPAAAPTAGTDAAQGSPSPAPATPAAGAIHIAGGPIQTSALYLTRNGPLMVPKPEDKEEKKDEKKDSAPEKEEVEHPASAKILETLFSIEKKGELGVARAEEEAAAYVVRFDDLIYPDSAGFAAKKDIIEQEILNTAENSRLTAWRKEVFAEARGHAAGSELDEKAEAGGATGAP
jgi:hypothetical protein